MPVLAGLPIRQQLQGQISKYLKYLVVVCLAAEVALIGYWANNLGQIAPSVVIQPLLIILLISFILFNLLLLILRSLHKASLVMLLLIIFFFSYGHLENLIQKTNASNFGFTTTHFLVFYITIILIGLYLVFRIKKFPEIIFSYLQIVTGLVILYNLTFIVLFEGKLARSVKSPADATSTLQETSNLPDVYYILLDAYSRNDVLKEIYNFDNSQFLDGLRERGFYIPECAFSNYHMTINTLASVLNMDYLDSLGLLNKTLDQYSAQKTKLVLDNQIRHIFADRGYQFVTASGYASFNNIQDSDIFLDYYTSIGKKDEFNEWVFVRHFLETTLLRVMIEDESFESDTSPSVTPALNPVKVDQSNLTYEEASFWYHQTNYVFDSLADLSSKKGNYLVYAHINSPHAPFVFNKDGSFRYPLDTTDSLTLYSDTLVYLNERLLALVDSLIENADIPPIIIIQADHGSHYYGYGINKHKILSAYYLPGEIDVPPYDTITPVNNFRLILHDYYDASVKLLPDTLYVWETDKYESIPASCDPTP